MEQFGIVGCGPVGESDVKRWSGANQGGVEIVASVASKASEVRPLIDDRVEVVVEKDTVAAVAGDLL